MIQYGDVPEAQEQHVVEFVFAEGSGDGDEEGLSEEWRAGVVVARLFVLLPQVHWDHYVVCIFHPVYRQLKSAERERETGSVQMVAANHFLHIYVFGKQSDFNCGRADCSVL